MISKLVFEIKCRFDYNFNWDYYKRLEEVRNRLISPDIYIWDSFMCDVSNISKDFKLPERYIFEDLKESMENNS